MTVTSKRERERLRSKYRKKEGERKETEKRREGRILWGRCQRLGAIRRAQWSQPVPKGRETTLHRLLPHTVTSPSAELAQDGGADARERRRLFRGRAESDGVTKAVCFT